MESKSGLIELNMKKLNYKIIKKIALTLLMLLSIVVDAQENDVTKFMGIPVDGSKSDMISKLEEKGFVWNNEAECMEGMFNGRGVFLRVIEDKNKVYRILVEDAVSWDASDIIVNYNRLIEQFENNEKYIIYQFSHNEKIDKRENIQYEMEVNNKRYQSVFYQKGENWPKETEIDLNIPFCKETEGIVDSFHENVVNIIKTSISDYYEKYLKDTRRMTKEQLYEFDKKLFVEIHDCLDTSNRVVWFMIGKENDKFKIVMYYDNVLNAPNGEDL